MKNLNLGMKSNARPHPHLLSREKGSQSPGDVQRIDAPCHFAAGLGTALCLVLVVCIVLLARPARAAFALYTADGTHNTILKLNAQGQAAVFATNGVNGVLDVPVAMAMDDRGYLYVVNNTGTNTIEVYDPQGNGSLFGSVPSGLNNGGLAMDVSNNVYMSQLDSGNVLKFTNPQVHSSVFGALTSFSAEPFGLAFDGAGNLYVGDFYRGKIYMVNPQGVTTLFATLPASPTPNPIGLAFDSSGNLYVAVYGQSDVLRYSPPATNSTVFVSGITDPYGLAFDSSNNLYVASAAGSPQIYRVDQLGNKTVFANAASGLTGTGFLVVRESRYQDNWNKVAGGGGTSTNEEFLLNGTIGQQDAGTTMVGGEYGMAGGFWARISVVPTPGAPKLTISITTTNTAMVSWPSPSTGWNLQQNTNLTTSAWAAAPETVTDNGTIKYIIVNPPAGNLFFRLSNP